MIYKDKKQGYDVEVFTTKEEGKERQYTGIEVTKNGDWVSEIGCWFEDNRLVDYDGVYVLPMYAIRALRAAGWTVSREYEEDLKQ